MLGPVETKHDATHFKGAEYGSNNTGKLTAICEGLLWTNTHENANPIAIYYDSKYAAKITTEEYTADNNEYLAATARNLLQKALTKRKLDLNTSKDIVMIPVTTQRTNWRTKALKENAAEQLKNGIT